MPRIPCCSTSRRAPAWQPKTRWCSRRKWRLRPMTRPRLSRPTKRSDISEPGARRSWRGCTVNSITRDASLPRLARSPRTGPTQLMARVYGEFYHARGVAAELRDLALSPRTAEQSYDGIAWLYGGPEPTSFHFRPSGDPSIHEFGTL